MIRRDAAGRVPELRTGALAPQRGEDFIRLGKAALLLLREDEPPVRDHVVLTLGALERLGIEALLAQLSRETRGSFVVTASDRAVEDLDAHAPHRTEAIAAAARLLTGPGFANRD